MENLGNLMSHEDHRWSYMTEEQLARRVKKIKNPKKLSCFIRKAEEARNTYLLGLAWERSDDLQVITNLKKVGNGRLETKKAEIKEKWEVVKEKEIDDRFLDF